MESLYVCVCVAMVGMGALVWKATRQFLYNHARGHVPHEGEVTSLGSRKGLFIDCAWWLALSSPTKASSYSQEKDLGEP